MEIVTTKSRLREVLAPARRAGQTIGLVPTMGALHEGHMALIRKALVETNMVVVSVFVNPTQFNNTKDLISYPRDPSHDEALLRSLGVQVAFMPTVKEMYPEPDEREFSFPPLDSVMEGARRPGHFNGVCQIVSKLLELVSPDRAFFGEKDFQQLLVVRRLAEAIGSRANIVGCPTVREADGLAMSSRNLLLTPAHRATAPVIHRALSEAREQFARRSLDQTTEAVITQIEQDGLLKVEYLTFASATSLEEVLDIHDLETEPTLLLYNPESNTTREVAYSPNQVVAFVAVQAGAVRLIDNQRM